MLSRLTRWYDGSQAAQLIGTLAAPVAVGALLAAGIVAAAWTLMPEPPPQHWTPPIVAPHIATQPPLQFPTPLWHEVESGPTG